MRKTQETIEHDFLYRVSFDKKLFRKVKRYTNMTQQSQIRHVS